MNMTDKSVQTTDDLDFDKVLADIKGFTEGNEEANKQQEADNQHLIEVLDKINDLAGGNLGKKDIDNIFQIFGKNFNNYLKANTTPEQLNCIRSELEHMIDSMTFDDRELEEQINNLYITLGETKKSSTQDIETKEMSDNADETQTGCDSKKDNENTEPENSNTDNEGEVQNNNTQKDEFQKEQDKEENEELQEKNDENDYEVEKEINEVQEDDETTEDDEEEENEKPQGKDEAKEEEFQEDTEEIQEVVEEDNYDEISDEGKEDKPAKQSISHEYSKQEPIKKADTENGKNSDEKKESTKTKKANEATTKKDKSDTIKNIEYLKKHIADKNFPGRDYIINIIKAKKLEDIKLLQLQLIPYYDGHIDGIFNSATLNAIENYIDKNLNKQGENIIKSGDSSVIRCDSKGNITDKAEKLNIVIKTIGDRNLGHVYFLDYEDFEYSIDDNFKLRATINDYNYVYDTSKNTLQKQKGEDPEQDVTNEHTLQGYFNMIVTVAKQH